MPKIVIDIPQEEYKRWIEEGLMDALIVRNALRDGTSLEKVFEDVKSEIENQYNWLQSTKRALYDVDIAFDAIRKVIDSHIGEKKDEARTQ